MNWPISMRLSRPARARPRRRPALGDHQGRLPGRDQNLRAGVMDIEALRRGAEAPVQATAADLPAVTADLADAFADDVMFDWFMRADDRRDAARLEVLRLHRTPYGLPCRPHRAPGRWGAAAVWLPFEALGPTPLTTELRALPTLLFATGLSRFSRLAAVRETMDKHHPMDRPHAYPSMFPGRGPCGPGPTASAPACSRWGPIASTRRASRPTWRPRPNGTSPSTERHGFEVISENRPQPGAPPCGACGESRSPWNRSGYSFVFFSSPAELSHEIQR